MIVVLKVSIFVTTVMLIMQLASRPFVETAEEASHWSAANKMAALSYVCQLVILVVGFVDVNDTGGLGLGGILTVLALVSLLLPLVLTLIIIRSNAAAERKRLSTALNHVILGQSTADRECIKVANPMLEDGPS